MARRTATGFALAGAGVVLGVLLATLGGTLWHGPDLDTAQKLSTILGVLVSAASLAVGVATFRRQRKPPAPDLTRFAEDVRSRWDTEAAVRGVRRPAPIRVRWASTTLPVAASASAELSGDILDAATGFRTLPHPQLVILGEPGGGKSTLALLLLLDLLNTRDETDPVPFLVQVGSWHWEKSLYEWLAEGLAREHTALGDVQACQRLLAAGRILPILDGFDELPPEHLPSALEGINLAVDGGKPLILTCRTTEYRELIEDTESPLAGAAVIELEPVSANDILAYLDTNPLTAQRWRPVLLRLRSEPAGELATVLATPLMLSLARTLYADPATDPADLLRLPHRTAIEHHLLDGLIPTLYRDGGHHSDDVERWMIFLARYQDRWNIVGIDWWDLHFALPPLRSWLLRLLHPLVGLGAMLGLVLGVWSADWLDGTPRAVLGATLGAAAGLVATWWATPRFPNPVSRAGLRRARRRALAWAIATAVAIGVVLFVLPMRQAAEPGTRALIIVVLVVFLAALVGLTRYGIVMGDMPVDFDREPQAVLRADRSYARSQHLVLVLFGLLGLAIAGQQAGPAGVVVLAFTCLTLRLRFASASFTLTRWLLALDGSLPRDLLAFLHEAHQRGLLRRSGPGYEFRHRLLLLRLAERGRLRSMRAPADRG
ncbi:NACHT domain-containing protein [Crossiella sp. CA198]|uniref:NACHT domain-containing protein n=1 Tax=Crossiella sp. CA198 TaxID=3455607 RepID=UPI003F8D6EE9